MQVNREVQGEVVARATCGLPWETALGDLDQAAFPMLGALDPYGDAVFNHRQIPALLRELDQLPSERGGAWVAEVRTLCELVLRGLHHYLLFIGDLCQMAPPRFGRLGLVALVLALVDRSRLGQLAGSVAAGDPWGPARGCGPGGGQPRRSVRTRKAAA